MRSALAKLPGVEAEDVVVDYATKTARIHLDGKPAPTPEQLQAAFEGTRFSATIVE